MKLLDLPSEVLRNILLFLDGNSLINLSKTCSALSEEINDVHKIWKNCCKYEMERAVFADTLIKNDPHGTGIGDDRWKTIYEHWVKPKRLFRHSFRIAWTRVGTENADKMKVSSVTTHGPYVLVHWSNLNNFSWQYYCLIFNKDLKLVKTVETSSNRDFLADVSICSEESCEVVLMKSTRSSLRPFGCFSKKLEALSLDSLRQKNSSTVDYALGRSVFFALKCYPTCSRSYGSIHLIGTDNGILFIVIDNTEFNDNRFAISPVVTKVNTPCVPITSIDVSETDKEFVVVCSSHVFVSRITFPQ